eukprot:TRINITY_DN10245_c0_g1_i1.p1 TRINITY_DN10245_c0_g1~~TRINITY_DN10245_c0_g1_i1.p1  ORF type:complete len:413 (-),score=67.68 TRINITY_DN10245_c0_g1_i1:45-1283(-)
MLPKIRPQTPFLESTEIESSSSTSCRLLEAVHGLWANKLHMSEEDFSDEVTLIPAAFGDAEIELRNDPDLILARRLQADEITASDYELACRLQAEENSADVFESDLALARKLQQEENSRASDGRLIGIDRAAPSSLLQSLHHERQQRTQQPTATHRPVERESSTTTHTARHHMALVHEARLQRLQSGGTTGGSATAVPLATRADDSGSKRRAVASTATAAAPSGRAQLSALRARHEQKWRSTKLSRQRIFTMDDMARMHHDEEVARARGPPISDRRGIHTIENTFENSQRIGREALAFTNEFRAQHKLPPLEWHQALADIGAVHSRNMGDGKVPFGHDGFNERMRQYPFRATSAAENVAMNHGFSEVARVAVDGWIDSPGHRKNLLSNHVWCGIGVVKNGQGKWYLTQLFGK